MFHRIIFTVSLMFMPKLGFCCNSAASGDIHQDSVDLNPPDKSQWLDPNDMVNFDISSNRMRKQQSRKAGDDSIRAENCESSATLQEELRGCRKKLEGRSITTELPSTACDHLQTESIYIKHVIKKLLQKLQIDISGKRVSKDRHYDAILKLSKADLAVFSSFISSEKLPEIHQIQEVLDALDSVIRRVSRRKDAVDDDDYVDVIWNLLPTVLQIGNLVLLIPAGGLILYHVTHVSKWKLCLTIFFLSFWLSVIWTWLHLYKSKQAELMARISQSVPSECQASDFSFGSWFRKTFTFNFVDPCVQFHKDMLIDPFWEVPPTEAIAVTLTKFVLSPLEHIGDHLGRFFRALFGNLPMMLWPVVTVSLFLGVFMLAILFFGYSIRLPFGLLQIGPGESRSRQIVQEQNNENKQIVQAPAEQKQIVLVPAEVFNGAGQVRNRTILRAKRKASNQDSLREEINSAESDDE